ncbi:hypothetical protein ACWGTI_32170 [Mesorhizobium sp. ArgA1]
MTNRDSVACLHPQDFFLNDLADSIWWHDCVKLQELIQEQQRTPTDHSDIENAPSSF